MWITCSVTLPGQVAGRHSSRVSHEPGLAGPAAIRTVLIRAEAATPLGAIAAALAAAIPVGPDAPAGPVRHRPAVRTRGTSGQGGRHARREWSELLSVDIDGVRLDPGLRLDASPLRDGSVVGLSPASAPVPARTEPAALLELRVTGGPGAGAVHRLAAGEYEVGTAAPGGIALADRTVPPGALSLRVNVDGSYRIIPAAGIDVWIDGCHCTGPVLGTEPLVAAVHRAGHSGPRSPPGGDPTGRTLRVGATSLLLTVPDEPDALLRPLRSGAGLEISREPRLASWPAEVRYRLPALPTARPTAPLPMLALLLPAGATAGMAVVLHAAYLLVFAALAPLTLLGSHLTARRHSLREHHEALVEYERTRAEINRDAAAAIDRESTVRRRAHPDPAALLLRAVGPRRGLWERRPEDPDFLHLRVGTGDVPSGVTLEDPAAPDHRRATRWLLRDVPVTVALPEVGVLGIAGAGGFPRWAGSWLVTQAATLHSPRDLTIHLLLSPGTALLWEWARWLPHCRPLGGLPGAVLVGADETGRARQVEELAALAESRRRQPGPETGRTGPAVLVIVEGAATARGALIPVLQSGPAVGMHVVCLETDHRLLPPECTAVFEQASRGARLRRRGRPDLDRIRPDLVGHEPGSGSQDAASRWCERLARALAPIHDPGPRAVSASIMPTQVRLLDLLGLDPPASRSLAPRWVTQAAGVTAAASPLGVSTAGPVSVDLSRDGPHALIAGTTGAGKSELLQSLVASLAVRNRPDEMTFVLVDYKGGSAFGDCARLPHTVGLVTDLDPHLVSRALDSLGAELRRRERLFAAAGSRDIDDYHRYRGTRPGDERPDPLPRLVVVVDEFAALARELPDFVHGLVSLAGRGRSLGIHLVLATQRPAGVVSPEILANTNLRVALRVTDHAESTDVLGIPDAALIPGSAPGRAILRVGQGAPVFFQTARVGGAPEGDRTAVATRPDTPLVIELPWPPSDEVLAAVARSEREVASRRPPPAHPCLPEEPTDLRRLTEALRETARVCRIPDPRRPWLAPLPVRTTIGALPPVTARSPRAGADHRRALPAVPLGIADICRAQAQPAFALDLERGSHLLVLGAPRSGRSTVLRTLAGSVCTTVPPDDVHLYGLDCGNSSLAPIADLPHTGAVVAGADTERAHRLLARLAHEVSRRQALLAAGGHADLAEARRSWPAPAVPAATEAAGGPAGLARGDPGGGCAQRPDDCSRPPYLLLLLDGYEGFLATFEDLDGAVAVDRLLTLARDGPAVGLRLVVTADRRGLTGPLASTIEQRLVLQMAERADYGLAGLAGLRIPDGLPPGRGFLLGGVGEGAVEAWAEAAGPVEVQVALLDEDPSGASQAGALRRLGARARLPARPRQCRPFRIDVLPTRVSLRELTELVESPEQPDLATVRGGHLGPPRPVVLGVGGDELAPVTLDLAADGPGVVIAGPPRSGRSSALLTIAHGLASGGCRLVIVSPRPSPLRRLAGLPAAQVVEDVLGADPRRPADLLPADHPTVLLVDDVELVVETAFGEELAAYLRGPDSSGHRLVAAGTTDDLISQFRGLAADARRSRCGLLLTPVSPADGDLFGTRLPRTLCGPGPPGRGVFLRRGHATPVQTADPRP